MQRTQTRQVSTITQAEMNSPAALKSQRLQSIDLVRGLALIAMLWIHSSGVVDGLEYIAIHNRNLMTGPTIASAANLIGLVLHIATPTFMLLSGFGLALFITGRAKRGWTDAQIDRYLLIRGGVLFILDAALSGWKLLPELHYKLGFNVLACVGVAIWLLILLRRLPPRALIVLMLALLGGTQLIYYFADPLPTTSPLYAFFIGGTTPTLKVSFPVLGWLPVILLGYLGSIGITQGMFTLRQFSRVMSLALFSLWIVLVAFDGFGKLYHGNPLYLTKYPPGLAYLSFYLGWAFLLLSILETGRDWTLNPLPRILILFGQTSLFFFVIHEDFLLNGFQLVLGRVGIFDSLPPIVLSVGVTLAAAAILVVLCRWYRDLKKRYPRSLLQYF